MQRSDQAEFEGLTGTVNVNRTWFVSAVALYALTGFIYGRIEKHDFCLVKPLG
jgi:hypothetical protein